MVRVGDSSMRRALSIPLNLVLAGAVTALSQAALAQAPAPAPRPAAPARPAPAPAPALPAQKPYKAVAVTLPATVRDAGLEALRKELGEIAKRRDRAALAQRIVARDFFWERDFSGSYDAKRPSIDNLVAALTLDADDGSGWDALAAFVTEPSVGPLPGRPAIVCAPALPQFDEKARDQLLESTETDGVEWNYPRAAGLQVRAGPQASAAVIETLGLHLVRILGFEDKEGDADPERNAWARVATPSGKTGFVAPNSLVSSYTDRLCYVKEGTSPWRIAGYIGGGD
jgi:hypothetical protein